MRAACIFLASALALLPAFAATPVEPVPKALRILFIGNGLTEDVAPRLARLALALGRTATVETLSGANYALRDHWEEPRTAATIRKGWDVVVLQQGPSAREPERTQLKEYGKRLAALAREAGAKPALLAVWPRADRPADFLDVIAAYREAAVEAGALLLPASEAWLRALGSEPRLRLYSGATQPGSLGSDLTVLTVYLSLFPAGPQEFDEAFVAKAARALEIPRDRRDILFDAATRAIDEPMALK